MVNVGVHVSIAGSLDKAVERAEERGCDCFQIFTKNPRGWTAKPITPDDAETFRKKISSSPAGMVFAHMPYLPNLAGEKPELYQKSVDALIMELERCDLLGIPYLVTHLGHSGDGIRAGQNRVISGINQAVSDANSTTILLLENTAGEKNSVGSTFEDISIVLSGIDDRRRTGVCFDTCHAFAAGYDLRDEESLGRTMDLFEDQIGAKELKLVHLNDTKGDLGSGLDRHEHIGLGYIGEGIRVILNNGTIRKIPLICETPVDDRRGDRDNIIFVRSLAE